MGVRGGQALLRHVVANNEVRYPRPSMELLSRDRSAIGKAGCRICRALGYRAVADGDDACESLRVWMVRDGRRMTSSCENYPGALMRWSRAKRLLRPPLIQTGPTRQIRRAET